MNISFGKYKGQNIKDIFKKDRYYIEWLMTNKWYKERHIDYFNLSKKLIEDFNKNIILNEEIVIYTDGSCLGNGRTGAISGIGVHYSYKNKYKLNDISQKIDLKDTIATNNHAELYAINVAINNIIHNNHHNKKIILYTDSKYSINCINKWYAKWLENNKITGRKNIEEIREIYNNIHNLNMDIDIKYIRGHTKLTDDHHVGNNIADDLSRNILCEN